MREQQSRLLRIKLAAAARRVKAGDRFDLEDSSTRPHRPSWTACRLTSTWLAPKTFGQFLSMPNPTAALFNQLASETKFWTLLDQIESACFLNPTNLAIARPLLAGLYEGEISTETHFSRLRSRVSSCGRSRSAYRIGNLRIQHGVECRHGSQTGQRGQGRKSTEGIPTWIKLSHSRQPDGSQRRPAYDYRRGPRSLRRHSQPASFRKSARPLSRSTPITGSPITAKGGFRPSTPF